METINKLQFKHHNEIFTGETLDEARGKVLAYLREQWYATEAFNDPSSNYRSLYAEPTVFRYAAAGDEANPHIILLIGAKTNNNSDQADNRFCIIDIDKTEQEIEDLREEIEKVVKSLTLTVFDTKTLDLSVEKTEDGTFLSGDVKTADTHVFELDGEELNKRNNLMIGDGDAKGPEGLFLYIDLTYDEENDRYTFLVSQTDGTLKKVILPNNYLVSGEYDITDEAIHLHMKDGEEIVVDCKELILEWTVEGESSNTPIVLTRERVDYDPEGHHNHEDILRADIRVAEELPNNILDRTTDGRYLYVKGTADNIRYSDEMTVKEAIDSKDDRISTSEGNLIYRREDGIYAHALLKYNQAENKIGFEYTDGDGELNFVEYQLNSVKFLEDITYDPVNETIIIRYIDTKGEYKQVVIPVKDIIEEWDVKNEGHNVELVRVRKVSDEKDELSADVKIHEGDNNILEDKDHTLYVNGISDNIKYDVTGDTTVKNVLDTLSAASVSVNDRLDEEIARSEAEDTKIEDTIGSGFSTDAHETITYKFNELTDRVAAEETRAAEEEDRIEAKLDAEITRSTAKDVEEDGRLDSIETNIGDGFGSRNTVRDEFTKEKAEREASDNFLSGTIETLSANTEGRLKSVVNNDHSIDVDNTDVVNPVIKVNLSEEVEDGKPNIIKLNTNGLYAGVDLSYVEEANKLIFKTTNATKEIQLESMSSIIDIRYDASKEAIVITYMTNGHEIKTVEIPVGDLIREWKPSESTDGAIKLTLTEAPSGTTAKDILYGEVLISDHVDNILINDGGRLYVSNASITANTAAINALEGRMDTAEASIDALEDGLREETSARTLADEAIGRRIDQEIEDRIAAVSAESNRAISAETALQTNITVEETRAKGEETRIETKLDNEVTRSIDKDTAIETALNEEVSRSTARDLELSKAITDEVTRATSAETALQTAIETEATDRNAAILAEKNRAVSAETALQEALAREIVNREADVEDEQSRAEAAELALSGKIDTSIETERSRATTREENILHALDDEIENRISGDTILQNAINDERGRAINAESVLTQSIANEYNRAYAREGELNLAITNETIRANAADVELYQSIADETAVRAAADADLLSKINQEISRAQVAENTISEALATETNNRVNADTNLSNAITAETQARQTADDVIDAKIDAATFTFSSSTSVNFNTPTLEDNVVKANVKLQEGDNIIKVGQGLYATAHLSYDTGTNKIKLTTTAGEEEYQLAGATVIDNLEYDSTNKELVITYHDGNGGVHTVRFGVSELFNEWSVQNPSEDSAIELTKTPSATPGGEDKLSGRVLLTNLEDNAIKIVNNGLYVPAADMADAKEIALCTKNELSVFERAVIGHKIYEECGSGYTYEPNVDTTYISGATNFYNADFKLDQNLKRVEDKVDGVSGDTVCVDSKANKIYELLYGTGSTIQGCGEVIQYTPDLGSCVISAATSFMEADRMLGDQMCEILEMWQSGMTCTSISNWIDDGANKRLEIDVRASHGNTARQTDEEIVITGFTGDYIDPTRTEFTDTNALRIVCLQEGESGSTPDVKSLQNGLYLSNVWDCGLYYGPSDTEAKQQAAAAGYIVDPYSTDETGEASDYNYNNNVRQ